MKYPINLQKNLGIPINSHPGAFGSIRKYDIHTGIDLYGKEGDWVHSIKDGEVAKNTIFTGDGTTPWWLPTKALLIKSDTEYYVYGELTSTLKVGDKVKAGSKIGELLPVLPPEKIRKDIPKHSNVMLHLEKYSLDYTVDQGWAHWATRLERPPYLMDPTNDLINILIKNYRRLELLTI